MSMGILGRKVGMTQVFDEEGRAVPVTVVEAGPCRVVDVRTPEKHHYSAVQLGFGEIKPVRVNKPMKGYFEKRGLKPQRFLREFRVIDTAKFEVGQEFTVAMFEQGEKVDVVGSSKGKGFAGGIKRHHFGGGPDSHGASKVHRKPGSSGANSFPGHILKGKRMPGHMGDERVTTRNLVVVGVDPENHLLLIKGALPGAAEGLLMIRKTGEA
jgi:large subunit ribosomal protein L3